jgi:alpha-galactosidase
LFNRGKSTVKVQVDWSELKLTDKQMVRDLWRQKDLGEFSQKFSAQVPSQGVVMVRINSKN